MPIEVTMPRLSDTMEQGTVVAWNVKEGDEVSAGDVLGDVETDKATMELQVFDDGTVASILLSEGQTVEVGTLMVVLAEEGEDPAEIKKQFASGGASASKSGGESKSEAKQGGQDEGDGKDAAAAGETSTATATAEPATNGNGTPASANGSSSGGGGRIFASPLAKKLAEEKGVDLASLEGSGPSGRIVKKDVESAAAGGGGRAAEDPARRAGPPSMPAFDSQLASQTVAVSNMRATIAKRLVESKQTIPHYQVTVVADMDALLELREQLNAQLESQGVKLSVNDFLVRACALAMHEHPFVNASWGGDGKSIDQHADVNVGVAIALPMERGGGLVVATLRGADQMGLRQISAETKRLAKKARDKGLTIDEMGDATFTISNLGMFGVEHFTAIINPPNSAILAVGAAIEKPVVRRDEDGEAVITIGHEMQMTMSSDHRVIDGAMAAQYLGTVRGYLEAPATLLV